MKQEKVRTAIELIGIFAVVGSLLLLTWEISQNTEQMEFTAQQSTFFAAREHDSVLVTDSEFSKIYYTATREDYKKLSPLEWPRFQVFASDGISLWEFNYHLHEQGMLSDAVWHALDRDQASQFRSHEAKREVWILRRDGFSDEFQAHIDAIVSQTPG